eukprot:343080-Pyramimonas_sp.AAC.1
MSPSSMPWLVAAHLSVSGCMMCCSSELNSKLLRGSLCLVPQNRANAEGECRRRFSPWPSDRGIVVGV